MPERSKRIGDLFAPMEKEGIDITEVLAFIRNTP
jgi:hypothetical protein